MSRYLIIFMLFCATYALAQPRPDTIYPSTLNIGFIKKGLDDTRQIVLAPRRWQARQWLTAGAVVGVTAGLYTVDADIRDWAQARRTTTTANIAAFAKLGGDGWPALTSLALAYVYGKITDQPHPCRVALLAGESFVISNVFTQAIKFTGHRHRPRSGSPPDVWDGPSLRMDDLSFPSGHSNTAFSVATVLALEYRDTRWVPPLAYGLAGLTALSRIHDNAHWASDAFVGSCIGYFTGRAIEKLHAQTGIKLALLPDIGYKKASKLIITMYF
jgi:membrane-associated phospholipid phosphatase